MASVSTCSSLNQLASFSRPIAFSDKRGIQLSSSSLFSNPFSLEKSQKLISKRKANHFAQQNLVLASSSVDLIENVEELQKNFEKKGVKIDSGLGDLTRVTLTSESGSTAEIYLYGGVVTSWKSSSGEDFLYVRPDAVFTGKKPISGGIPHCFPQFGPGAMQQHGFARNLNWQIVESKGGESPSVVLRLTDSDYTRAMFDYSFENLFEITLGTTLSTKLTVKNLDQKPFSFTTALHTYFRAVAADAKVLGLQNLKYLNKFPDPNNPIPGVETREEVDFPEYVDCMYLAAPSTVSLLDGLSHTINIESKGWNDVVIWNPHLTMEACYKEFVCVENAQLETVTLAPGEVWVADQVLSAS